MAEAKYRVEIHRRAERDLRALSAGNLRRVSRVIDSLAISPRPDGCKKLVGAEDIYRVRVGDDRILYQIMDRLLLVIVIRAAHRGEAYRGYG